MKFPQRGVLPVIHLQSEQQAIDMAGLCQEAGASGIFLIDHSRQAHDVSRLGGAVTATKAEFPELWVGMNCLALYPEDSLILGSKLAVVGVWVDDAVDVNPTGTVETDYELINTIRYDADICYFGGIAMKGGGYVDEAQDAADKIRAHMHRVDVVVTSGPETGMPTTTHRLEVIRAAIGNKPLAVASGVNFENIAEQSRFVDYALVASSIEERPMDGRIVRAKLEQLIQNFENSLQ